MKTVKIKFKLIDKKWFHDLLSEGADGQLQISLEGARLLVPPHVADSKNFTALDALSVFAEYTANVSAGILGAFLYDAIKAGRVTSVQVNNDSVEKLPEIEKTLSSDRH